MIVFSLMTTRLPASFSFGTGLPWSSPLTRAHVPASLAAALFPFDFGLVPSPEKPGTASARARATAQVSRAYMIGLLQRGDGRLDNRSCFPLEKEQLVCRRHPRPGHAP